MCPLYRGLDTLTDWNPTHTTAQHAGWLTRSRKTQQLGTILKQTEVLEAVRRGLVATAVYTLLHTHAEDPQGHGGTHATDGRCQDSGAAHIPHPRIPAACSHPAPNGPSSPPQTAVLSTVRTYPTTYHPTRDPNHAYTTSTGHNTGRAHRSTTGTAHTPDSMRTPPAPTPPRHCPPTGTANCQQPHVPYAATTNGPALRPRPLGLPGSRTPPHPLPLLRGPQPPLPRAARGPSRIPPLVSHASLFRPLTHALWDHLGGYYVAHAADHAGTIAMATSSTPLPPHSAPLRHSGGDLNVAAHHVLLALYLHHRHLHLPDPQLPAPKAAAPTPEAWADTAP